MARMKLDKHDIKTLPNDPVRFLCRLTATRRRMVRPSGVLIPEEVALAL